MDGFQQDKRTCLLYDEEEKEFAGKICDCIKGHHIPCHDEHRDCSLGESVFTSLESVVIESDIIFVVMTDPGDGYQETKLHASLVSVIEDEEKKKKLVPIYKDMASDKIPTYIKQLRGLHFKSSCTKNNDAFWEKLDVFLRQLKEVDGMRRPQSLLNISGRAESLMSVDSGMGSSIQGDAESLSDRMDLQCNIVTSSREAVEDRPEKSLPPIAGETPDPVFSRALKNTKDIKKEKEKATAHLVNF